jgi:hypothetical protein
MTLFFNFASSFGGKKGKRLVADMKDFAPFIQDLLPNKQTKEQSVDEMKQILTTIASAHKKKGAQ